MRDLQKDLRLSRIAGFALFSLLFPGCSHPPEWVEKAVAAGKSLFATQSTGGKTNTATSDSSSGDADRNEDSNDPLLKSEAARAAKRNAEILQEVMRGVFAQRDLNPAEFGNLLDSLNQGASIEGIYNGLIYSKRYRDLEVQSGAAAPALTQAFAKLMTRIQMEMPEPTPLSEELARPPGGIVMPSYREYFPPESRQGEGTPIASFTPAGAEWTAERIQNREKEWEKLFAGSSAFTAKRILGQEALRWMDQFKAYPEKRADRYSIWATKMAASQVDFGLPQRNQADESFHFKWAMEHSADQLKWEVLNRVHRLLNLHLKK